MGTILLEANHYKKKNNLRYDTIKCESNMKLSYFNKAFSNFSPPPFSKHIA